jgi:hypothetical protein
MKLVISFLLCLLKSFKIYTTFFVFPSGLYTNKSEDFPRREQATYSCPCEKHGFSKPSPHNCPCAFLMAIAEASRTGNCKRLNLNDISVGIIGIRGNSTSSPLNFPFKIVASMILFIIFFTGHWSLGHLVTWSLGHLVTWLVFKGLHTITMQNFITITTWYSWSLGHW